MIINTNVFITDEDDEDDIKLYIKLIHTKTFNIIIVFSLNFEIKT